MMKILITTWINYDNFGSLLQAYCLRKVLNDFKIGKGDKITSARVLNYWRSPKIGSGKKGTIIQKLLHRSLRDNFDKIFNKAILHFLSKPINERRQKFQQFRDKHLNLYPEESFSDCGMFGKMENFDLYVAGSDQIWNPKLLNEEYLLGWTPDRAKKISYAPSICVNHLSKTELKKYKVLESFTALSVREYTDAAKQISQLVHKEITEVADPVILFGRENLLRLCKKQYEKEYAAIYLLNGAKNRHESCRKFTKDSELDEKIIPTLNPNSLISEYLLRKQVEWEAGPLEFIDLIYNARVLITDSFHGVVVALLLHKDFVVLPREEGKSQQSNRLIKLLEKVGLEGRFGVIPGNINEIESVEWAKVDKKIEKMRRLSEKYLSDAIKETLG